MGQIEAYQRALSTKDGRNEIDKNSDIAQLHIISCTVT